jgi:uridine monophosphate synthetase
MRKSAKSLIKNLYSIGAIQFGNFKLKSGKFSPYYVDLRILISYPKLLNLACNLISELIKNQSTPKPTMLCGIASAGIPIATILGQKVNLPIIVNKKESIVYKNILNKIKGMEIIKYKKNGYDFIKHLENIGSFKGYGIQKYVDGCIFENSQIGLVDDLITTAESKLEVMELLKLEKERIGLKNITITDVYVLLDREQSGSEVLEKYGITLHSVFNISEILKYLKTIGFLNSHLYYSIIDYISNENKS